jgi:hypothetical protein
VTNIRKLAKPGVIVVTFGPNDLSFNLEGHEGFPLASVDDCMRHVAAQLEGAGIRIAMAREPSRRSGIRASIIGSATLYTLTSAIGEWLPYNPFKINTLIFFGILFYVFISH